MESIDFDTALALAFACWAGVVGWMGRGIRSDLQGIGTELRSQAQRLNEYIIATEVRLATIEQHIRMSCDTPERRHKE
jgi:hypothetical protein